VLVTGAGGYIGGRLVGTLLDEGWDVHAIVREPVPRLQVAQTVCDLADVSVRALAEACEGATTIVHLAGENEVVSAREPATALATTVVATERLIEAAARAGIARLVYMSTVHVYGERMEDGARLTEDLRPEPRSSYAISRLASEHVAAMLTASGSDLVVLRLTNSVGAPIDPAVDRWTLVANDLCRQGALSGRLVLRSSGIQWRDFVALRDVCSIIAAAARVEDPVLPPGTYNLGSGRPVTVRALAEMIQDAFERCSGERPELHAPAPEADRPKPYHVSIDRVAGHGLRASSPLEDAVEETVRFCLEHREEIR
jgi:UDP-glucose 4-epimerase